MPSIACAAPSLPGDSASALRQWSHCSGPFATLQGGFRRAQQLITHGHMM
jgi:hypothetical protein